MGGNGSFIYQSTACEDGRQWKTIATCGKIQIIEMKDRSKSNGMPAESHTPGRIYAMFRKDGKDVGSIAQYGKNGQKTLIQHRIDEIPDTIHDHLFQFADLICFTDSEDLTLAADHQNIRSEDLRQNAADVIENNLARIVIVKKLSDFSGLVE